MKLADLKIGVRLGVAFGAVLVLLVAITVVAELKMAQMNARTEHLVRHDYRLVALGTTALDNTRGSIARVFQLVGDADPARLKTSAERLDINLAEVDKALADLDKAGLEGGMRAAHARANAALVRYKAAVAQVRREIAGGRTREATAAAYGEAYPALHALAKEIRALVDQADNALDAAATTSTADYRTALAMMLAIGAIAVALGGALAWWITRSITAPLRNAVAIADRVAAGDLSVPVPAGRRDEVGQLLGSLGQMSRSLVAIVGQVREVSDSIATGSAQIATGNADLSQRTESQASSLQQTAASMEQLTATVRQSADTAKSASALAGAAAAQAGAGGDAMQRVVATMRDISESSRRIGEIIAVIDGIAFQTNILALNAAVEAARAGEQGRGFAVVAGEVRALAQRSAAAAREIKSLIAGGSETVDGGSRLVDDTGTKVGQIVEQVTRVNHLIAELERANSEQRGGIEQIGQAMGQLDQATQQNAALVEESAAAAESLRRQAEQLTASVARFRLAG